MRSRRQDRHGQGPAAAAAIGAAPPVAASGHPAPCRGAPRRDPGRSAAARGLEDSRRRRTTRAWEEDAVTEADTTAIGVVLLMAALLLLV
jgi:hypothetical protein